MQRPFASMDRPVGSQNLRARAAGGDVWLGGELWSVVLLVQQVTWGCLAAFGASRV